MKKLVDLLIQIRNTVALKINDWLESLRMKKFKRMESSRNDWKEKARIRADEIREYRKSRRADRKRIENLADEVRQLKAELKKKNLPL
jgi:uncharacterized protein involved in exopolysaccharide biosynthesis